MTKALSLRQKILQMFILGYETENPKDSPRFLELLKEGLGGVIFFTRNITSKEQFKSAVDYIKNSSNSDYPLFLSIDQEGGRVERTLNIYGGSKYLSAREAAKKGDLFVEKQTKEIAIELKDFGLNMDFAPVLDVDTNPCNPIIAERSYSSKTEEVVKYSKIAANTFLKNGIIPVGKHFPGHGETSVDSHKDMPVLDMSLDDLESIHIKPFCELVDILPAIMVAHIHYTSFDKEKIPASISKNVVTSYLREKLGFDGLVISDDMVMGGIRGFSSLEACKRAIEAGVNVFIFRDADENVVSLIDDIEKAVLNGELSQSKIDESFERVVNLKNKMLRG